MPARLLNSSVFVWPSRDEVDRAARARATGVARRVPHLQRLGCFGSYARGDHGVGSDLDLVAIVAMSDRAFVDRGREWDLTTLPVPAEILVHTAAEWETLQATGGHMARALAEETVWIVGERDARQSSLQVPG